MRQALTVMHFSSKSTTLPEFVLPEVYERLRNNQQKNLNSSFTGHHDIIQKTLYTVIDYFTFRTYKKITNIS